MEMRSVTGQFPAPGRKCLGWNSLFGYFICRATAKADDDGNRIWETYNVQAGAGEGSWVALEYIEEVPNLVIPLDFPQLAAPEPVSGAESAAPMLIDGKI